MIVIIPDMIAIFFFFLVKGMFMYINAKNVVYAFCQNVVRVVQIIFARAFYSLWQEWLYSGHGIRAASDL